MHTSGRSIAVTVASLLVLVFVAQSARAADEPVDNPRFQRWAKFNVGSSATFTGEMGQGNFKGEMESVYKLAEKADDHVVVEITTTMTMAGNKQTMPLQKVTINAKAPKADVKELGKEDVEAAGKKYPCTMYELSNFTPQMKNAKLKAWVNDDIPGGIVKMEIKGDANTITSTLKSFEVK